MVNICILWVIFYVMTQKYKNYTMIQFKVLLVTEEQDFAAGNTWKTLLAENKTD